jgi:hypothetical protein
MWVMGKIKNPSEKRKKKQFSNVCIKILRLTLLWHLGSEACSSLCSKKRAGEWVRPWWMQVTWPHCGAASDSALLFFHAICQMRGYSYKYVPILTSPSPLLSPSALAQLTLQKEEFPSWEEPWWECMKIILEGITPGQRGHSCWVCISDHSP